VPKHFDGGERHREATARQMTFDTSLRQKEAFDITSCALIRSRAELTNDDDAATLCMFQHLELFMPPLSLYQTQQETLSADNL